MTMEVAGKGAVVTGGASGIGRGIAHALAGRGARVVLADLDEERARAVAGELAAGDARALGVACDVTIESEVERLAERAWGELGPIDLLFNNAGVGGGTALIDSTAADMRWLFAVNVFGVWHGVKAFGRRFRDQKTPAWICNTGSEHSLGVPHLFQGMYTATKHAVLGLSDVLRRELPAHVGVSVLCPGVVATDLWRAGERRPTAYGGPEAGNDIARSIMSRGMDPLEVGRRAVAGVERGDFFIVTHPHARAFADARHAEIGAAFEAQAPRQPDDEKWDVNAILAELLKDLTPQR